MGIRTQQGGKIEGKLDGRMYHNTPPGVLARLSGEIAYTQKRLCIRTAHPAIRAHLNDAAKALEVALELAISEYGVGSNKESDNDKRG